MEKIFKFPLKLTNITQILHMPSGAEIMDFQMQGKVPTVWAIVGADMPIVTRYFFIRGTGHEVDCRSYDYIGTSQDEQFVWHLFEDLTPHAG